MENKTTTFPKQENTPTYVALYRISTTSDRQALSVPFQKESIKRFIEIYGGKILHEFEEEASGTSFDRVILDKVVDLCQKTGSILLVHKLSRLSRDGFTTIARLKKNKVNYIEAVSPNDSEFVKGIKMLQAEDENVERRANIKSGLDQIKRNIKKKGFHISKKGNRIKALGNPKHLTQAGRDKSIATRRQKALNNSSNKQAISILDLLLPKGLFLNKMATHLNEIGFSTATGKEFTAKGVSNLLKLYGRSRVLIT